MSNKNIGFKRPFENLFLFFCFSFNTDPSIRVTTISAVVGQLFMSLSILGCQQSFVQRYCSMESQKQVTKYVYFKYLSLTFFITFNSHHMLRKKIIFHVHIAIRNSNFKFQVDKHLTNTER